MLNHDLLFSVLCCFLPDRLIKEATCNVMVDHLQSRATPWRQYASHVKVRGTLSKLYVPNKILKACSDKISPHLSQIFNISLTTKCCLDRLKFAKVEPVYKEDDKDNLDNYRPMSVLLTVARVFEKLIYEQIIKYFESNDLLSKKQWGFGSLHSTVLSVMSKANDWFINISKGHLNVVVFLDVKKSF